MTYSTRLAVGIHNVLRRRLRPGRVMVVAGLFVICGLVHAQTAECPTKLPARASTVPLPPLYACQLAAETYLRGHSLKEFAAVYESYPFAFPDRLRKFNGFRISKDFTNLLFTNAITRQRTMDAMAGDRLALRRIYRPAGSQADTAREWSQLNEKDEVGVIGFGPGGEQDPRYRIASDGRIDEVYRTQSGPAPAVVIRTTLRLPADARLSIAADATPDTYWNQAKRTAHVSTTVRTLSVVGAFERKEREQLHYERSEWNTSFEYNADGSLSRTSTEIRLNERPAGRVDSTNGPSVAAQNFRDSAGRPLLPISLLGKWPLNISATTLLFESAMTTSWGAVYRQYRVANDPKRLVFEVGAEKRLVTASEDDLPVQGYLLDAGNSIVAEFAYLRDSPGQPYVQDQHNGELSSRRASEIFTPERMKMLAHSAGKSEAELWNHLDKVGVEKTTRIPFVTYWPYQVEFPAPEGSRRADGMPPAAYRRNIKRKATVYLLPVDPPRSRELARESETGDFTLNFWWDEGINGVPFGILPESLSLITSSSRFKGPYFRRAVYEGLQPLFGLRNLRASLGGVEDTRFQAPPETLVRAYLITSNVPQDNQYRSLLLPSGQLAAQDFRRVAVLPFQGLLGTIPPATYGLERTFYDLRYPFRFPTISVADGYLTSAFAPREVDFGELRRALANVQPDTAQQQLQSLFGSADGLANNELLNSVNATLQSAVLKRPSECAAGAGFDPGESRFKGVLPLRNRIVLTECYGKIFRNDPGTVFRLTESMTLSPQGDQEETNVSYLQAEVLGPQVLRRYKATFIDDRLNDEERRDVSRALWNDPEAWKRLGRVFGSIGVSVLFAGWALAAWSGRQRRAEEVRPVWIADVRHLTELLSEVRWVRYGFQPGVCEASRMRLEARLTSSAQRHRSVREFHDQEFAFYQNHWRKSMGLACIEAPEPTEAGMLNRLALWYLIYSSTGNFSNPVPAFRCFLFDEALRIPVEPAVGDYVAQRVSEWLRVMAVNLAAAKTKPQKPQEQYLNYDDVQGLFLSARFVDGYRARIQQRLDGADNNILFESEGRTLRMPALGDPVALRTGPRHQPVWEAYLAECAMFKTYGEKATPKWGLPLRGWGTLLRNYYSLAVVHVFVFYALIWRAAGLLPGWQGWIGLGLTAAGVMAAGVYLRVWLPAPWADGDAGRPDRSAPRRSWRQKVVRNLWGWLLWTAVIAAKYAWEVTIFSGLWGPTEVLLHSHWLYAHLQLLLVGALWSSFTLFFLLDTFAFFYLATAILGYLAGKFAGVGRIRYWRGFRGNTSMRARFDELQERFCNTLLPPSLDRADKLRRKIAWAKTWNLILDFLYEEDRLSGEERERYKYILSGESEADYLQGRIKGCPDLKNAPRNPEAEQRLLFFATSLFMNLPRMPEFDEIPSRTVITPLHNESVIYGWQSLNEELDVTRGTIIGYLAERYRDEWKNFLNRLAGDPRFTGNIPHLEAMSALRRDDALSQELSDGLRTEVCLWASYRFQAMARTVRGVLRHTTALQHLFRLSSPLSSREEAARQATKKFQYLVYFEYLQSSVSTNPHVRQAAADMRCLMDTYPDLEVVCVSRLGRAESLEAQCEPLRNRKGCPVVAAGDYWAGAGYYLIRFQGGSPVAALRLPGWPMDGQGSSKPERQNLALMFARGEKLQVIDMNQDDYFEEALKAPCVLREFERTDVRLVGFPERMTTESYGTVANYAAFADRTFVTLVQRVLTLLRTRFHYGHPDLWDAQWVTTRGGLSKPSYLNEDIFGAYDLVLQGAEVRFIEYVQAGKAREVSVEGTAMMYEKFGRGAGEQALSRYIYWLNTSPEISLPQRLTHFFGGIGFYISQPLAKYANFIYLITVILIGVSGFAAKQSEVLYGVIGIWMAQSIITTGLAQIVLERGFGGAGLFLRTLPGLLPFFQFHILTNAIGFQKALRSDTEYESTGRGFFRSHAPSSRLFRLFMASHTRWGFWALLVMTVGIVERQTYPIVWSVLFIINVLAALYVPFLFNRGGTPLDAGLKGWIDLQYKDVTGKRRSERRDAGVIADPENWMALIKSCGNATIRERCRKLRLAAYMAVILGGLTLFGMYVLPACKSSRRSWRAALLAYALHLTFAAILFLPVRYSFGHVVYTYIVFASGPCLLLLGWVL